MVAAAFVKITVLVLGLKVPPLLLHAPLAPEMVTVEAAVAFKIPPLLIVSVPTARGSAGNVGSLGVVPASGITTLAKSDGNPLGLQFVGTIHAVQIGRA